MRLKSSYEEEKGIGAHSDILAIKKVILIKIHKVADLEQGSQRGGEDCSIAKAVQMKMTKNCISNTILCEGALSRCAELEHEIFDPS